MQSQLTRGQFVSVGNSPGIVVAIYGDADVPEDHVAVWYGEAGTDGAPRVRTVPEEYALPLDKPAVYYH